MNYGRAFCSAVCFANRYIYIIGGTTTTECFEIFDTYYENENPKCELVLLELNNYMPWFKEILIPLDEEGLIIFCRE